MSIELVLEEIRALRREVSDLRATVEALTAGRPLAPADDTQDPKVRFDPRDWKGASCKGKPFSQCPAEFLECLARTLTWMATKDEAENKMFNGKPSAPFSHRDAAIARRWALRVRTGQAPEAPPPPPPTTFGASSSFGASSASPFGASSPFGSNGLNGASKVAALPDPFGEDDDDDVSFDFGANKR